MLTVTLKPNTARLKQLIREHGATWRVLDRALSLPCFNGAPGVFIQAGGHSRWARMTDVEIA